MQQPLGAGAIPTGTNQLIVVGQTAKDLPKLLDPASEEARSLTSALAEVLRLEAAVYGDPEVHSMMLPGVQLLLGQACLNEGMGYTAHTSCKGQGVLLTGSTLELYNKVMAGASTVCSPEAEFHSEGRCEEIRIRYVRELGERGPMVLVRVRETRTSRTTPRVGRVRPVRVYELRSRR